MTSDPYAHVCGGRWEPFGTGGARYRCTQCCVIGLKRRVIEEKGTNLIDPYKCGETNRVREGGDGSRCSKPAVAKNNRTWMCHEHNRRYKGTS